MIWHYLKIAFRISGKTGKISIVNILGLAIGLAACIMIFLYVRFESSYDTFHKDNERIFRVEEESTQSNDGRRRAICRNFLGMELEKMDEVEALGRIEHYRPSTISYRDIAYKESRIFFASDELFNIMAFNVLEGHPYEELKNPRCAVITEKIKQRYFGKKSAYQELLKIDTTYYRVVGVVEEFPSNSHFHFDILLSYVTANIIYGFPEEVNLFYNGMHTYVKLKENVGPEEFGKKLYDLPERIAPDFLRKSGDSIHVYLNNIRDIHFQQGTMYSFEPSGNLRFLGLLIATGILILVTTCVNYMNLSTSRFVRRNREIGIRKTFGSGQMNLVKQFLGESLSEVIIAFLIAMALVEIGLDPLSNLMQAELSIPYLETDFIIFVVVVIVFTTIAAGSYPAFMLSSINPVNVIRSAHIPGKGSFTFRRILIVFQFMISIFLIMATLIISGQLKFMNDSPLGFIKEQKLVFQLPEGKVLLKNYIGVKEAFAKDPLILGTSISSSVPGKPTYNWLTWPSNEKLTNTRAVSSIGVDRDFFDLYGLKLVAGEPFYNELYTREDWGVLINQSAIKTFGLESEEEALKKEFNDNNCKVRGIIKDFHFFGMNQELKALFIYQISEDFRYLTLSFAENSTKKVLDNACKMHRKLFPGYAIDYFFLDEDFAKQYEKEKQTGSLVMIFTILAVFIASLGLYGMTAYTMETKKRTFSLMKVHGASSASIYKGIMKEFLMYITLSFAVVAPIIIYAGTVWLTQFPYHANLSLLVFIYSILILAGVSFVTINFETIRIFRMNPVDTIGSE